MESLNIQRQAPTLTPEQEETQRQFVAIIQKGYQRAAASFSTMIGTHVGADNNGLNMVCDRDVIDEKFKGRENSTMIITSIIGQLRGESYFLLTEAEEEVICGLCRKAFGGGSTLQNELVLKEIDNIISAAVITEFSNHLKLRIYGDVPHLYQSKDTELWNAAIKFKDDGDDYFVMANANFQFPEQMSITPLFIWRFEKKLVSIIEENRVKILNS